MISMFNELGEVSLAKYAYYFSIIPFLMVSDGCILKLKAAVAALNLMKLVSVKNSKTNC